MFGKKLETIINEVKHNFYVASGEVNIIIKSEICLQLSEFLL